MNKKRYIFTSNIPNQHFKGKSIKYNVMHMCTYNMFTQYFITLINEMILNRL